MTLAAQNEEVWISVRYKGATPDVLATVCGSLGQLHSKAPCRYASKSEVFSINAEELPFWGISEMNTSYFPQIAGGWATEAERVSARSGSGSVLPVSSAAQLHELDV
jgi:hypothetical protein